SLLVIVILTFAGSVASEDIRQQISQELQQICDALTGTGSPNPKLTDLFKKNMKFWKHVETCSADGLVIKLTLSDGFRQCWYSLNLEAYAKCLESDSFFCDITINRTLKRKCKNVRKRAKKLHAVRPVIVGSSIAVAAVVFLLSACIRRRRKRQMTANDVQLNAVA
uniref:Conserved plasma membrane protein n=1 Tax=Macrostomum lignano TaxID=282301 RepID=A0A1I8J169_9PLAT